MLHSKSLLALSVLLLSAVGAQAAPTNADTAQFADRIKGADTNHDKSVTRAELISYRAANFDKLDRDNNGVLTGNDLPSFARASGRAAEFNKILTDFDLNHDGHVSRDEFVQGPTIMFDTLDLNHNGIIEPSEFDQAK